CNDELSRKITHILNTKLTAANKFSILDRGHIDKIMAEKGLVWLGDASLKEKAKIGNLLGTDYILTLTVTEAQLTVKEKYLEAIGRKTYEHEAKLKIDFSLINSVTSQIKLADSVRLYLEDKDVRKLVPKWQDDKIDYLVLAEELIKSAAGPITDRITGSLYPARIAKILPDNVVIINKGGQDISVSDIYDVLKQGEEIIDYDTKESLGKIEESIGTIKITKVMSNFSYAVLMDGDISKISEGSICKKKEQKPEKPIRQQSDTKLTPSGGVKMPFDK
ncbi:MAG: CsgG/HfaB family protein, partial [Phycisphaerae bacterium]|nr:CsgG/HfaB family protein [Phycisphaerae bacterium]